MDPSKDKTLGIVLTTVPLNDRMQLVNLYTRTRGRVTCRVPVATRGRNANRLRQQMTPMTVLDLQLGGRPTDRIRTIAEAVVVQSPYLFCLEQPDKAAQCLYMAELLAHTVREEEANEPLWDYILGSLEILEHSTEGWANFHLIFTCGLTARLGFLIDTEDYEEGSCLDLREGVFTHGVIMHPYYLNAESTRWFCRLFDTPYEAMPTLQFNHAQRAALLDMQLSFLSLQIPEMGQLRSVEVLKSLYG